MLGLKYWKVNICSIFGAGAKVKNWGLTGVGWGLLIDVILACFMCLSCFGGMQSDFLTEKQLKNLSFRNVT